MELSKDEINVSLFDECKRLQAEVARLEAALAAQPTSPKDDLRDLRNMPDSEIDTSDIPEVKDWSNAERGKFYRASPVAVNAPPEGMTFEEWWMMQPEAIPKNHRDVARMAWQACSRTNGDSTMLMECGHPKACWIEEDCKTPECPIRLHGYCKICLELADRERAIEAAALENAAILVKGLKYPYPVLTIVGMLERITQRIRALITPDRQIALEEALENARHEGIIEDATILFEGLFKNECLLREKDKQSLDEALRKARLDEAEWWHLKFHKPGAPCIGCVHVAALRTPAAGDKESGK